MESHRYELTARLVGLLLLLFAPGCVSHTGLYAWGDYDECVYDACSEPNGFDRQAQIVILTELVDETEAKGRSVAPGVRAHLAYLHYLDGNPDLTVILFRQEMTRFPESTTFYEGMLRRMGVPPEEADESMPETGDEALSAEGASS